MALDPYGGFALLLSPVRSTSSDLGVGISSLEILPQRFSSIPLCIAVVVLFSGVLSRPNPVLQTLQSTTSTLLLSTVVKSFRLLR